MNTYSQTIISLAFHPVGYFIAVACGMSIQLWDWQNATGEIEGDYFPIVPATDTNPNSVIANKCSSMDLNNAGGSKSESDEAEAEFPVNWRGITHTRNIRAVLFHPSGEYIFAVAPDSPKPASEELAHCKYVIFFLSYVYLSI
jgi:WD40 repeat protein